MFRRNTGLALAAVAAVILAAPKPASALPRLSATITVDEFGHGTISGPAGSTIPLQSGQFGPILEYGLPSANFTPGLVVLTEPAHSAHTPFVSAATALLPAGYFASPAFLLAL